MWLCYLGHWPILHSFLWLLSKSSSKLLGCNWAACWFEWIKNRKLKLPKKRVQVKDTKASASLGELLRKSLSSAKPWREKKKKRHLPLDDRPRSCSLSPWVKTNKQQSRWWQQHLIWTTSLCTHLFTTANHVILIRYQTNSWIKSWAQDLKQNWLITHFLRRIVPYSHWTKKGKMIPQTLNEAVNKMC